MNILFSLRIKNVGLWIEDCLNSLLYIRSKGIDIGFSILDDGSQDKTKDIVFSTVPNDILDYKFRSLFHNEVRDWSYLYKNMLDIHPDWWIVIDGDEVIPENCADEIIRLSESTPPDDYRAYSFYRLVLWDIRDDEEYYRTDKKFFPNLGCRMMYTKEITDYMLGYNHHSNFPEGLHCQAIPREIGRCPVNVLVKDYSYSKPEWRLAKYNWLISKDKGTHYEHIIDTNVSLQKYNIGDDPKKLGLY